LEEEKNVPSGSVPELEPEEERVVERAVQRKLVLVVDDDPDLRFFVREALEHADYRVRTAANGSEALLELTAEAPDVMLLDLRMPGLSGDDVIELLERMPGRPPIVIMTAADRARDSALAHRNPYYLAKPFDPAMLIATIETALSDREEGD